MISNTTCLLELVSKRKDNYNVMKSYDRSCDRSNPIKTILYLPKVHLSLVNYYPIFLTFLINLPNQLFKSIYVINLLIESTATLAYGLPFLKICVYKKVYSYLLSYI